MKKISFSSFDLKVIALGLMTLDHIYYFLQGILPIPMWFTWLGRISAPLFIFMVAYGMSYTHNRKRYLTRLYIAGVLMYFANNLVNTFLPHPNGAMAINGMFQTMFLIGFYICGIEKLKTKERKDRLIGLSMIILPVFISVVLLKALTSELNLPVLVALNVANAFLPSPLFVEGSFMMILLGVGMYFLKENRVKFAVFYLLVCLVFLLSIGSFTYENLFMLNYQWMMVFALPLMLLYNGKQGLKVKYFFYLYYPLHVYALVIAARLLV